MKKPEETDGAPGRSRPAPTSEPIGELDADVRLLGGLLGETLRDREAPGTLERIDELRHAAVALRAGRLEGGRDGFAARFAALSLDELDGVAHAYTQLFHLVNAAEEQHRIRVLRRRDRKEAPPDGSVAAAVAELARAGVSADEMRAQVARLFVMPVLTAHPTEARRRTLLDHLAEVSQGLDQLDDPRPGARARRAIVDRLREAVCALYCTGRRAPCGRPRSTRCGPGCTSLSARCCR
jgi:phosphoenolpyruvate carboxylase